MPFMGTADTKARHHGNGCSGSWDLLGSCELEPERPLRYRPESSFFSPQNSSLGFAGVTPGELTESPASLSCSYRGRRGQSSDRSIGDAGPLVTPRQADVP